MKASRAPGFGNKRMKMNRLITDRILGVVDQRYSVHLVIKHRMRASIQKHAYSFDIRTSIMSSSVITGMSLFNPEISARQ